MVDPKRRVRGSPETAGVRLTAALDGQVVCGCAGARHSTLEFDNNKMSNGFKFKDLPLEKQKAKGAPIFKDFSLETQDFTLSIFNWFRLQYEARNGLVES